MLLIVSRLNHICSILLVAFLVISNTSCTPWREAKGVIAEADRLLVEGVIMRDTAALGGVIRTLDHPVVRWVVKEELAEAYYLMGRNLDDYYHNFAEAAEYYIAADRLKTNDLVLRGRINSCMGFLCKQDSCFAEALMFYERANEAFAKSGNEKRYANGLVSIAEQYVNLEKYEEADSVLQIASRFDVDSACYARMVDVRALALYNQRKYESALVCLLSIKDYVRPIDAKCHSYLKIMQSYAHIDKYEMAAQYAHFLISHTNNPNYRTNAYYCLIKHAEINRDTDNLARYSYLRKDEDCHSQDKTKLYAKASNKLKSYLDNPNPYRKLYFIIAVSIVLLTIIGVIAYWIYRRHQHTLREYDEEKQKRCKLLERRVFDNSIHFLASSKIWDNTGKLKALANNHFNNIFYRLEEIEHLTEHDRIICLMILLEFSNKEMASVLHVQPNTISKSKKKIAKDIGIASSEIRAFLISFLA